MISTHILDTSSGNPAKDVEVILKKKNKLNQWEIIDQGKTNSDGRYVFNGFEGIGIYQINFAIENYFKLKNIPFFFLDNSIIFQIESDQRKYHVPLLLNPYGYSTYRGS